MKRQWKIRRTIKESRDSQNRWDRAYQLILEIARSAEDSQKHSGAEVHHANSDLRQGVDPTSSPNPNH